MQLSRSGDYALIDLITSERREMFNSVGLASPQKLEKIANSHSSARLPDAQPLENSTEPQANKALDLTLCELEMNFDS